MTLDEIRKALESIEKQEQELSKRERRKGGDLLDALTRGETIENALKPAAQAVAIREALLDAVWKLEQALPSAVEAETRRQTTELRAALDEHKREVDEVYRDQARALIVSLLDITEQFWHDFTKDEIGIRLAGASLFSIFDLDRHDVWQELLERRKERDDGALPRQTRYDLEQRLHRVRSTLDAQSRDLQARIAKLIHRLTPRQAPLSVELDIHRGHEATLQ